MRFGRWYALREAGAHAPASPGVLQVRIADGLIEYPTGRSAMIHYAVSEDVRGAAVALAARHPDANWLCRHATDGGRAQLDRLLERFAQQFGMAPSLPLASFKLRVAAAHARFAFDGGGVADVVGEPLTRLLARAEPLLTRVRELCAGPVRAVSVTFADRVLRATYDGTDGVAAVRVDGDAFERDIAPLCRPVVAELCAGW